MSPIEHLEERAWEHPGSYAGFSPVGDYVILTQTRDSDALERSNYECAFKQLKAVAAACPELEDESNDGRSDWVYDFRASHWACGWIETLLVRKDAPEEVLQEAGELICALADYPVVDEDHFSQLEWDEACEYWERCSVRDRFEIIKDSGADVSIFAARSDCMPGDVSSWLRDSL